MKKKPQVAAKLAGYSRRGGAGGDRAAQARRQPRSRPSSWSSSTRCSPRPRASATTSRSTPTSTRAGCRTSAWRSAPLTDPIACCDPAPPPARGARAGRLHPLRGRHARHQRRVRHRRRARRARARAAMVPRGREPRRGHLPPARRDAVPTGSRGRAVGARSTQLRTGMRAGRSDARASDRFPAARTCCCTRSRTCCCSRRDALRLPGELDPRADLRRLRGRALRPAALHREPRRRGHARRARRAGPPHRGPPRARAARGRAVLERSGLRPALPGRGHGGALAARRRLPRLRADRRDLLRDAQRLPRPRARRADARVPRRGVLPTPSHDRAAARAARASARAARAGARDRPARSRPTRSCGPLRSTRRGRGKPRCRHALRQLDDRGIPGPAIALALDAAARAAARTARPDLVWSGPEVPGLHARDTRRSTRSSSPRRSARSGSARTPTTTGQQAFRTLADRMEADPRPAGHDPAQHPAQARRTPLRATS